ncbi:MAG TPA: hypothetical protein VGF55_33485 [Gemmataceae bacterium]|jgi:hypothetical protein
MWSVRVLVASVGLGLGLPAAGQELTPPTPNDPEPAARPAAPPTAANVMFKSDLLGRVVDGEGMLPARWQNREEVLAYEQLVLHARQFAPDVLAKAARRDLRLPLLLGPDKARYRGVPVHLEGSLRMLEQMEPSSGLAGMAEGLTHVYRGWVALDGYKDELGPVLCAVDFTELPPGILPPVTHGGLIDRHVGIDAFFFKVMKYETREPAPEGITDRSPDGKVHRLAPLFVARTIRPRAVAAGTAASDNLWQTPAAVVAGTVLLIAAAAGAWLVVSSWLRREDARVRARLKQVRPGAFPGESAADAGAAEFAADDGVEQRPFGHSPSAN